MDSLKVNQNKDGTYTVEWDKNDPNWKWMNSLTSKEVQGIIEKASNLDNETHLRRKIIKNLEGVGTRVS